MIGFNECVNCETRPIENQDTKLCSTCGQMFRKAERDSLKVKVVKPIRKVSAARAKENKEYIKLRNQYLSIMKVCEVVECSELATQCHHKKGRENELLLDTNYFMAVCDRCHEKITTDSAWAISQQYSFLRSVTKR